MIQHATATTVTVFVNRSKLLDLCEQGLHHQIFDMKCVFEVLGYDGQPATDTFAPQVSWNEVIYNLCNHLTVGHRGSTVVL